MFIGRDRIVANILHSTEAEPLANDLAGGLGTGKTSILRRLEDNAPIPRPLRLRVNLEDYNPGHRGEQGAQASVGAVQGSFQQLVALLEMLTSHACGDEGLASFKEEVADARNAEVMDAKVTGLQDSMDELREPLRPEHLANAWRSAERIVAARFLSRWNAAATELRLLLLDNVDEVADQEIGIWLGELLSQLERTMVVLTRTADGPRLPLPAHVARVFEIANFDEQETQAYLDAAARLADREPLQDSTVHRVFEVTKGHPATLATVNELLWGSHGVAGMDPDELLLNLPEQQDESVAALVERLVSRRDDALGEVLWAAAVPRRFDALLLEHLLGDPRPRAPGEKSVFEIVAELPFTEKLTPDGDSLRLHSYVRNGLLKRLSRTELFDTLHVRAARYYERQLTESDETGNASSYGEAFLYEDPKWQRRKREWLYHRGHAKSKEARDEALLEFSRVFLDAFWWWANYIHFDFCDQLVTDLAHLAKRRAGAVDESNEKAWQGLEALHQALQRILRGYPLRSAKSKNADWDDVREALRAVQRRCGVNVRDPRRLPSKDQRHVAALLSGFMAHTYRYQAPERPEADLYYQEALDLFALDRNWSEAWVAFEWADLRFERGEADAVPDLWHKAADLVQPQEMKVGEEPDEELVSNLHRLRGDCCWAGGDRARAAMWYGLAVLHAYLFHLVGGPPDDYTLQFYVDIRARALSRLLEVWEGEKDVAVALATDMATAFPATYGQAPAPTPDQLRSLLDAGKALPLAHALFPRGPEVSELYKEEDTPFLTEHDKLGEALRLRKKDPARDLHDPVWP